MVSERTCSQGVKEPRGEAWGCETHQAQEVQSPIPTLCSLACFQDGIGLVEIPLLDANVDFDNVLPDDAASADVEMADLGVTHQSV